MERFSLNSEIRTKQQRPLTPHPPYSWQNSNFQNIFFLNFYTFLKLHHFRIFQLFSTIFCAHGGRHWFQLLKLKKIQKSHFYGFYRRFSKNFQHFLKLISQERFFLNFAHRQPQVCSIRGINFSKIVTGIFEKNGVKNKNIKCYHSATISPRWLKI